MADSLRGENLHKGLVEEALPGLTFRVQLDGEENYVLAYVSGKMKLNRIKVLAGDKVLLELSPDGRRGRIVRRI